MMLIKNIFPGDLAEKNSDPDIESLASEKVFVR